MFSTAPHSRSDANDDLLATDCDVLAPCALDRVLTEKNVGAVRARYLLEGANGPCIAEAHEAPEEAGVTVIPDIWVNAGGVTASYFEWTQNIQQFRWPEERVAQELETTMNPAWRATAYLVAVERVRAATDMRDVE